MPRLFTALEIPAPIAFSLSLLRGGIPGARWVDSENYHITLRLRVDRPGFELELGGLDALGSRKPHAVVACVRNSPALRELQAEQERLVQRIGLEPERRKFRPHVTLARLKGTGEPEVAAYLALRGAFRTAPFAVGRFVLLSSRASKGGGPYLVEEAYPLAA
jgi:2'-5' RNA ligase